MDSLKLGLLGLQGRMGQAILQELSQNAVFVLVKATALAAIFQEADVVVDFTHASATNAHLAEAVQHQKPFFLGTTGLEEAHVESIQQAARHIPLLQTSNTSLGALILEKMVCETAALLGPAYDIEIREIHHREKKDAPSGTALSLGDAALRGRGASCASSLDLSGSREGARKTGSIGFSVARGGGSVGEHEVLFIGDTEILRFSHLALGRPLFAKGALKGAQWLARQPKGLYQMADVWEKGGG